LVFNATAPFKHQQMVADGRLSLAGALHDMQGDVLGSTLPAVVFAPAVSLLAGPAATLLRAWKHDSRNLLVCVSAPQLDWTSARVGLSSLVVSTIPMCHSRHVRHH
jgi:hypothetical protein